MRRILLSALIGLVFVASASALSTGSQVTLHKTKTFKLASAKTKTFKVGYPDALKYSGSTYSGKVKILPPAKGSKGKKPTLGKVKILSQGSCLGGSDFCVKVRNGNSASAAAVRVRVTATTKLPPGKKA